MADDNGRRIEPRRAGLGQTLAPSPEDIAALRRRQAQAEKLQAPPPKQSFAQRLQQVAQRAAAAPAPKAEPSATPAPALGPPRGGVEDAGAKERFAIRTPIKIILKG